MSVLNFHGVPGTMTRRLAGLVIGTQGLAVFFGALVARALAAGRDSEASNTFLLGRFTPGAAVHPGRRPAAAALGRHAGLGPAGRDCRLRARASR